MIDVMSRGRLEAGFVRGVPYEIPAANTNPTQTLERVWEGIDLVTRAWKSHDEPFNYEGRFFHRRLVNVWPRTWQQPHPMIWVTGSSDLPNIRKVAAHGFMFATFLQPHQKVKEMFDAYRSAHKDTGLPGGGGVAYMPLVFVADTEKEAEEGARELTWYLHVKTEPQFRNPPGYVDVATNVQALKGAFAGRSEAMRARGMEFLREEGIMCYGTPDQVVAADQDAVRQGRRLRPPADDDAGRLHGQQAHRVEHPHVRQGSDAADQGPAALELAAVGRDAAGIGGGCGVSGRFASSCGQRAISLALSRGVRHIWARKCAPNSWTSHPCQPPTIRLPR